MTLDSLGNRVTGVLRGVDQGQTARGKAGAKMHSRCVRAHAHRAAQKRDEKWTVIPKDLGEMEIRKDCQNKIETLLNSDPQPGASWPPAGHMAMSSDLLAVITGRQELLVSSG